MEELYTSLNLTDSVNNTENISDNRDHDSRTEVFIHVMELTIVCIGLPMTLLAMGSVFYQVRKDHVTPVYFINLLISDIIQLCCLTSWQTKQSDFDVSHTYYFALMASVGFMVCISLERYLAIAKPLWYRFRQNIKTSVIICIVIWILPLGFVLPIYFHVNIQTTATVFALFFLLPLPLFIFFLAGTLKALSAAISVSAAEKRRIVASLVVVLLIYILLYLPGMIWGMKKEARKNEIIQILTHTCLCLSPLSDLTLYFFLRKGFMDKVLTLLCCCKMSNNQQTNCTTNENVSASCSEEV